MTEPSKERPAHRYEVLDSLRGICALMVALLHFPTGGYISALPFVQHGFLFVDFFFVLSGFVIAASYGDRLAQGFSIRRFMALRLGRIYPLHLFMLVILLIFEVIFWGGLLGKADRAPFNPEYSPFMFLANLLLIQTFVGLDAQSWNGPSWSIAVEIWTYLVFAMIYRWMRPGLVPVSIVIAVAAAVCLYFATDRYIAVFHDWAIVRCLYGFACGTIAYRIHKTDPRFLRLNGLAATLVEVAMLLFVLLMVSLAGPSPLSLAMPIVFVAAVVLFSGERGLLSGLLKTAPFLFLGALSYSIYMVHFFVQLRLVNLLSIIQKLSHGRLTLIVNTGGHNQIAGDGIYGDVAAISMLAVVVAFAFVTYNLVEKPGQAWSRRRILGPRPAPATARAEADAEVVTF